MTDIILDKNQILYKQNDDSEYIFGQDYYRNGVPNFSIILKEEKNFQKSTMLRRPRDR